MQHCGRRNVSHGFHSWPGFWERYLRETGRQARQQKRRGWAGCVVTHVLQSKQACWLCGQGIQSRERRNGGKVLGVRGRVRACCGATHRAAHKAATRRRTPKFIGDQSCRDKKSAALPTPRKKTPGGAGGSGGGLWVCSKAWKNPASLFPSFGKTRERWCWGWCRREAEQAFAF